MQALSHVRQAILCVLLFAVLVVFGSNDLGGLKSVMEQIEKPLRSGEFSAWPVQETGKLAKALHDARSWYRDANHPARHYGVSEREVNEQYDALKKIMDTFLEMRDEDGKLYQEYERGGQNDDHEL